MGVSRRILLAACLALSAGCIPPKVVQYTSFHDREFSARKQPSAIQTKPATELLRDGYLLIGYIDLRQNVRTCYEDNQCVNHSDALPAIDELQREAASRGGDILTLLEDRTVIEQRNKSICTNTTTSVVMVNNTPQVYTTCVAYRSVPGKLEAKISRALIWRHDPEAARGEANSRALDAALRTIEATYNAEAAKPAADGSPGTGSSTALAGGGEAGVTQLDAMGRQILSGIQNNDTRLLYALARDGKLQRWEDEKGRSALMVAILVDQSEATQTLLAIDRGLERRDKNGLTAMHYAVGRAKLPVVQKFAAAGHDLRQKSKDGLSLLYYSLWNTNTDVFEWLLRQGLDPRDRTHRSETALMVAGAAGAERPVRRLLELGVEINHADVDGNTALMLSASKGQLAAVRTLLKAGAKTGLRDRNGNTVLHFAASGGNREVLQLLLQQGLDINAVNAKDATPLTMAIAVGSWDAAHLLMDRGARLTSGKISAEDAAQYLISKNQPQLLKRYLAAYPALKELVQRDPDWLQYAAKSSGGETIRYLVELGARIDRAGSDGLTPLMTASAAGNDKTVRTLLELKANPAYRDARNQTALKKATLQGHAKVVSTLREFGVRE